MEEKYSEQIYEVQKLLNETLTEFTNLPFHIYQEHVDEDGYVTLGAKIHSIAANKNLNKEVINRLVGVLRNQFKINLEGNKYITKRDLSNFIEDVCIEIIFETDINDYNQYSKAYDFIRQLEQLSYKSYENEPVNTGVIMLKSDNEPKSQLSDLNVDFVPIDGTPRLDDLIEKEKPLLKLIDGKSLAFVLNPDFKVVGFARKTNGSKSIEEQIIESYNDKHYRQLLTYTLRHVGNLYHMQSDPEFLANKIDVGGEKLNKDSAADIVTSFSKLLKKYRGNMPNELVNLEFDELEDKLRNTYYIKVFHGNLQWFFNYNFIISLKNHRWKMIHHALLGAHIFDSMYTNELLKYCNSNTDEVIEIIGDRVSKIIELIKVVKTMSEQNIGGLFVLQNYTGEDDSHNTHYEDWIAQHLLKEKFEYSTYKKILSCLGRDDGSNILDFDKYLIILIASVDGATILDNDLNLISFGEIIDNSRVDSNGFYGARTNAAISASYSGLSIKISEDGDIEIYTRGELKYRI